MTHTDIVKVCKEHDIALEVVRRFFCIVHRAHLSRMLLGMGAVSPWDAFPAPVHHQTVQKIQQRSRTGFIALLIAEGKKSSLNGCPFRL